MSNFFIAKVVNAAADHTQSGSVEIDIEGYQDQQQKYRLARPIFPVTNPNNKKVGGPATGVTNGTQVIGFFLDNEKQIPVFIGTIPSEEGENSTGARNYPEGDVPLQTKNKTNKYGENLGGDTDKRYITPDEPLNSDQGKLDDKSIIMYAQNEALNSSEESTFTRVPQGIHEASGTIGQTETA